MLSVATCAKDGSAVLDKLPNWLLAAFQSLLVFYPLFGLGCLWVNGPLGYCSTDYNIRVFTEPTDAIISTLEALMCTTILSLAYIVALHHGP